MKTNGTLNFTVASVGRYEARLVASDANELLDRVPIAIEHPRVSVTAILGNGSVTLKWPAVSWPIAVEKYVALAGATTSGALDSIGELNASAGENTFTHSGQTNRNEVCYVVRAVRSGGQAIADSQRVCTRHSHWNPVNSFPMTLRAVSRRLQRNAACGRDGFCYLVADFREARAPQSTRAR